MWEWYGVYKEYNSNKLFVQSNPIFIPKRSMKIKNKQLHKKYTKRRKDIPEPKHHIRWRHVKSKQRNKTRSKYGIR